MKAILSAALVLGVCGLAVAADDKVDPVGTWKCEYEIGAQKRTATVGHDWVACRSSRHSWRPVARSWLPVSDIRAQQSVKATTAETAAPARPQTPRTNAIERIAFMIASEKWGKGSGRTQTATSP